MDSSDCGCELLADIGTLLEDLKEMHVRAVAAASRRGEDSDETQQSSGMSVRGR